MAQTAAVVRCKLRGRFPLDRSDVPGLMDNALFLNFRRGHTVTLSASDYALVQNYVEKVETSPVSKTDSSSERAAQLKRHSKLPVSVDEPVSEAEPSDDDGEDS